MSLEASVLGLRVAISSLCPPSRGLSSVHMHPWCLPSFCNHISLIGLELIFITSFNLNYFVKAPISNYTTVYWAIGFQHMD